MIVPSSKDEVSLFMRFFMINQITEDIKIEDSSLPETGETLPPASPAQGVAALTGDSYEAYNHQPDELREEQCDHRPEETPQPAHVGERADAVVDAPAEHERHRGEQHPRQRLSPLSEANPARDGPGDRLRQLPCDEGKVECLHDCTRAQADEQEVDEERRPGDVGGAFEHACHKPKDNRRRVWMLATTRTFVFPRRSMLR